MTTEELRIPWELSHHGVILQPVPSEVEAIDAVGTITDQKVLEEVGTRRLLEILMIEEEEGRPLTVMFNTLKIIMRRLSLGFI